ncbi:MAG TPA: Uma2 family endonuclease [Pyrinomonadaceae bacterium]|nr:Uma2 family endonuclease [Pyrinomonadaceae bacterium]
MALERRSEFKSEYFDGEIHAMTGASRAHNLVTTNVIASLWSQLRGRQCEVYPADMRVRIPTANVYTYPDVTVVCGEPTFEDDYVDTLLNPTLLVEILSKSTAKYDRTVKLGYYRTLESLAEYLLIWQDEYRVEQYTKQPDGRWLLTDVAGPEGVVELSSVGCALPLAGVYERVTL